MSVKQTEAVYFINENIYLHIQECSSDPGWDYTLYDTRLNDLDGGQLDNPEATIVEARDEIAWFHGITIKTTERVSIAEFERLLDEKER